MTRRAYLLQCDSERRAAPNAGNGSDCCRRGELPNFHLPGSHLPTLERGREVPKIETFLDFRNSRTQIAAHCDDPVLMYRTKSTLRNLPWASTTFFTNEIRLRSAPNFQFPVPMLLPPHTATFPSTSFPASHFHFAPHKQHPTSFQFPVSRVAI